MLDLQRTRYSITAYSELHHKNEYVASFLPTFTGRVGGTLTSTVLLMKTNYRCADSSSHFHAERIMPKPCSTAWIVVPTSFVSEEASDSLRSHPQLLYRSKNL